MDRDAAFYWMNKTQYYHKNESGVIIFNDDTPTEVIDSYKLYKKMLLRLDDFKTGKDCQYFTIKKY